MKGYIGMNFDLNLSPTLITKTHLFYLITIAQHMYDEEYHLKRSNFGSFQLIYTIEGEGTLHYKDTMYHVRPGDCFVIDCDEYHEYVTLKGPWVYNYIHFNGASSKQFVEAVHLMKGVIINVEKNYTFHRLFYRIKKIVEEKGVFGEVEISSLLVQLLSELMRSETPLWIQPVIDFIYNNYKSKITVDQLADLAHINKYYFIKKFKKEIGYSPYQYIINHRIDEAKYYLTHMDYTIGEIAEITGFESASNFSQQFTKIFHMSPQCYRKKSQI